jgi:hypothetical protein
LKRDASTGKPDPGCPNASTAEAPDRGVTGNGQRGCFLDLHDPRGRVRELGLGF